MSDLFEANEDDVIEVGEEFDEVNVDLAMTEKMDIDARRRLENLLDERRLQEELDDFLDY